MMRTSTHNNHTSWRHIWRLAWPIIISNVAVPLVGVVDVAMMGRIDDPAFIGGLGVALLLMDAWGLQGLLAAFVGYLGLRSASL